MNQETIYAVVDLETTGTNLKEGDRIIQIGCAFIQHGKIIQTLAQDINPLREIPEKIQYLTHISPDRLDFAPTFEDFAPQLVEMLKDTVFVAHNINFDLPFLNAELNRVGLASLDNPGIDTVELAQILLPTHMSYRLSDLSQALAIKHENPHQADSDAIVTAKLLLALTNQFNKLPLLTQKSIAKLSTNLLRQTGQYLALHYEQNQNETPKLISDQLMIIDNIVIRKTSDIVKITDNTSENEYPLTAIDKKAMFKNQLKWRKAQADMMDLIYQNYQGENTKPLIIEAATGLGKTIGYLLPFSYLLQNQSHKLVIATATKLLQNQIIRDAKQLNEKMTDNLQTMTLVKSHRHYLDIQKFALSLNMPDQNHLTKLFQMKILVWLTMTDTGDLDELNQTTSKMPFITSIEHQGLKSLDNTSPFIEVDFLRRQMKRINDSQILVTNHAYLVANYHQMVDKIGHKPYLVIDESQNLLFNTQQAMQSTWQITKWQNQTQKLLNLMTDLVLMNFDQIVRPQLIQYLNQDLNKIEQLLNTFIEYLSRFNNYERQSDQVIPAPQWHLLQEHTRDYLVSLEKTTKHCEDQYLHITNIVNENLVTFSKQQLRAWQQLVLEMANWLKEAEQQAVFQQKNQVVNVLQQTFIYHAYTANHANAKTTIKLSWQLTDARELLQQLQTQFKPITYTGATLALNGRFDYFKQQLGHPILESDEQVITKKLRSPFKFKKQARFLIAKDGANYQALNYSDYVAHLSKQLMTILTANPRQTLVLFNSHKTLKAVYEIFGKNEIALQREVLAQNISGTTEKIIKRFTLGEQTILLATNSFMMGVDFPDTQLQTVILVQLPFDSPDDTMSKLTYEEIKANGGDAFNELALPKATIKLRQAFGRLIRSETDRGIFICLDPRLLTMSYGHKMLKALPTSLPKVNLKIEDLIKVIDEFWLNQDI